MTNLKRWQKLWHSIGGESGAAEQFAALQERYSEPHRAYHTFDHISDCLAQFDLVRHQAAKPDEVEFALWLHDVIYDPHASGNEEKSAQWAVDMLHQGAVSAAVIARVAELIMVTRHTTVPEDIDLSLWLILTYPFSAAFPRYLRSMKTRFATSIIGFPTRFTGRSEPEC
jgi:predicted metal-dependent HD superfamily phosphohydrolase